MKKINENTRITLTIGQLKRLIKEEKDVTIDSIEVQRAAEEILASGEEFYCDFGKHLRKQGYDPDDLTELDVPEGVSSIDVSNWRDLPNLEHVTLPDSLGRACGSCLYNPDVSQAIYDTSSAPGLTLLDGYVADVAKTVTTLDLTPYRGFSWHAFWGASRLQEIIFPDYVTEIPTSALSSGTPKLNHVVAPNAVKFNGSPYAYEKKRLGKIKFDMPQMPQEEFDKILPPDPSKITPMYRAAMRLASTYVLLLKHHKRTNQYVPEFVKRHPTWGFGFNPIYISFHTQEEGEAYVAKYMADPDHKDERGFWSSAGVVYKVTQQQYANEPQQEIDTKYGKCLVPTWV